MKIFKLLLLLFTVAIGHAQTPINLGITGGLNHTIINGDYNIDLLETSNATGSFGAFGRLKIKKISLTTEALWVTKSGNIEDAATGETEKIKFTSFDFPMMLGYKFFDAKVLRLRVHAGAVASQGLNSKSSVLSDEFWADSYWSGVTGLTVDIPLVTVGVRYQFALDDFYTDAVGSSPVNSISGDMVTLHVAIKFL